MKAIIFVCRFMDAVRVSAIRKPRTNGEKPVGIKIDY